jgi:hypothetical protein
VANANTKHQWKRGDVLPAIRRTLAYSDGSVQQLTGAHVRFIMYPSINHTRKAESGTPIIGVATIVDVDAGTVEYEPTSQDTATAGLYFGEFEVVTAAGKRVTFPNDGYVEVTILDDLGDAEYS